MRIQRPPDAGLDDILVVSRVGFPGLLGVLVQGIRATVPVPLSKAYLRMMLACPSIAALRAAEHCV